jgi:murein DD-endopeptidase MepM/ murein hydrolase activator NlpD
LSATNGSNGLGGKVPNPAGDARNLLGRSKSDGSVTGDAEEMARHVRSGTQLGSRIGGGHGAAIGAAVGAGAALAKNKSARRRVAAMILVPSLVVALIAAAFASSVTGSEVDRLQSIQEASQAAAMKDGLKEADIAAYVRAADGTGVQWQLLAAVDWSAGGWSGAGDPPYGIDDLDEFNRQLAKYDIPTLSEGDAKDRIVAGFAYGRLFADEMRDKNPGNDPGYVEAGAVLMSDPEDSDRTIRGIDDDNPDSQNAHDAAKQAFTATIAGMPSSTSEDKDQIFDTAVRWATGQQEDQSQGPGTCGPGSQAPGPDAPPADAISITPPKDVPFVAGLNDDQVANAAVIIGVGKKLKIPVNGWKIALMAALVESSLQNIHFGDADSQGLFQMRPSAGWGTPEQITNPSMASQAFYGLASFTDNPGLVDIKGWQSMPLGDVAQKIEVSANPDAYASQEATAALLIKTLEHIDTGDGVDSTSCDAPANLGEFANCPATGWTDLEDPPELGRQITPDAMRTLRCGHQQFPQFKTVYTYGERAIAPDEHSTGRAIDWMIPGGWKDQQGIADGTAMANWLVKNHKPLGVYYVIWRNKIWDVQRDPQDATWPDGWRDYSVCSPPRGSLESCGPTAAHMDHVHVTVYGDKGVITSPQGDGKWVLPTTENYQLGAGVCTTGTVCWGYQTHTGQDISIYEGAPIRATAAGTVTTKLFCPELSNEQRRGDAACSYGRLVMIDHGGGIVTYYAHLNGYGPGIKTGSKVQAGQVIGYEGEQGHAYGAHLHYEVRKDGVIINPITYLEQQGVQIRCSPQMKGSFSNVPAGAC